jgi:hypothetical protein
MNNFLSLQLFSGHDFLLDSPSCPVAPLIQARSCPQEPGLTGLKTSGTPAT